MLHVSSIEGLGVTDSGAFDVGRLKDRNSICPVFKLEHTQDYAEPTPNKPATGPQHDALDLFLSEWKAEGQSFGGPDQDTKRPRANPTPWAMNQDTQRSLAHW